MCFSDSIILSINFRATESSAPSKPRVGLIYHNLVLFLKKMWVCYYTVSFWSTVSFRFNQYIPYFSWRRNKPCSVVTAIGPKPSPPAGDAPARDGSAALHVFLKHHQHQRQSLIRFIFNPDFCCIPRFGFRFSRLILSEEKGKGRWIENLDSFFLFTVLILLYLT